MRTLFATALAALLLAPLHAQGTEWRTEAASSRIEFSGTSQGSKFAGRFKQFTPRIRFDPRQPNAASFDVAIELASADTDNAERDDALPTQDFFWTKKFPRARFTASACRPGSSSGRFVCEGMLNLRGKSRKLAFPFTWSGDAARARLVSSVVLNRLDFDVGTGDWRDPATIGHLVTVTVALDLRPAATASVVPAIKP